jgi:hypothetical protein
MSIQAILELLGEPGAGKTTLATVLGEELSAASVLYVDASPDQRLTQILAPEAPPMTLAQLLQQPASNHREAIDWAFHDLTVSVDLEADLLTLGALPEGAGNVDEDRFCYGLTRLADSYDYLIVDGYHPLLHRLLPEETLRTVLVLTPRQMANWELPAELSRTPSIILNKSGAEPLSPALETALQQGQATLIGKIPHYPTAEECIRRLPEDFRNCLLRLNIPLNFSHS